MNVKVSASTAISIESVSGSVEYMACSTAGRFDSAYSRSRPLEQEVLLEESAVLGVGRGNVVPQRAELLLLGWIGRDGRAQLGLLIQLRLHQSRVAQAHHEARIGFVAVLHGEQVLFAHAAVLGALGPVSLESRDQGAQPLVKQRIGDVARELQLGVGRQAPSRAGIARNKSQFLVLDSCVAPAQPVFHLDRLAVLVGAEEGKIEIVARVGEIVRVAAELRDIELRREHQAHVGVLLVLVKVVHAARVERHHVAAVAGLGGACLLDLRHRGLALLVRFGGIFCVLGGTLDLRGHVAYAQQHVDLEVRAGRLRRVVDGEEPVGRVVVVGRAQLLDAVEAHVVVGEQQAGRGNERSRASAVKPHRGELEVVEECIAHLEVVFRGDHLLREVVKEPQALVCAGEENGGRGEDGGKDHNGAFHGYTSL